MSIAVLESEISGLCSSQNYNNALQYSSQLLETLNQVKQDLERQDEISLQNLPKVIKTNWNDNLLKEQKQLNSKVKKLDKSMEKFFDLDLDDIYNYKIVIGDHHEPGRVNKKIIDRSIIIHLLRNGDIELVNELCQDLKFEKPEELIGKFEELYDILSDLQQNELGKAIEWCDTHLDKLLEIDSDMKFQLYKLKFLQIMNNDYYDALKFAHSNFMKLGYKFDNIAELISKSLIYAQDEELQQKCRIGFNDIYDNFIKVFCSTLGLLSESPLYPIFIASFLSLKNFIKYNKLVKLKKLDWSTKNELPFEIPLPDFLKFHSIFICPVSKEETTLTNPPMVLPCHHILSQSTVINLSQNNLNNSFKCPYCPRSTRQLETKLVKFINL